MWHTQRTGCPPLSWHRIFHLKKRIFYLKPKSTDITAIPAFIISWWDDTLVSLVELPVRRYVMVTRQDI